MRSIAVLFAVLILVSSSYSQTFTFTADTLARTGEPEHVIIFHAVFESLIDDTQWVNFHVDPYDFPDENWTIGICNDSGCFAPGFNDIDNLYQPYEIDTLVSFDVRVTEVGDSGHFSATLTAARDPENPQTIHFTVCNSGAGVVRGRWTPETHNLITSYPNPFNSETILQFSIGREGPVEIVIYDLLGREVVRLLEKKRLPPGFHQLRWRGTTHSGVSLPSGVYLAKLNLKDEYKICRLHLLR